MKKIVALLVVLFVNGCNLKEEVTALDANIDQEKVWVFIQFSVPEKNDSLSSYYYYGRIGKSLYTAVAQNTIQSGFILLEEVKYWGDDDLLHNYEDHENAGELVFRIEDIAKIDLVKKVPEVGGSYSQIEEPEAEVVPQQ